MSKGTVFSFFTDILFDMLEFMKSSEEYQVIETAHFSFEEVMVNFVCTVLVLSPQ